jgi:hypothetical protein
MQQSDKDVEVTPQMRFWIDEAATALGMDVKQAPCLHPFNACTKPGHQICALDGVHARNGKEYLLERKSSGSLLAKEY